MNPSNPEAFRARFPAVIYARDDVRVVAHLQAGKDWQRMCFVAEGRSLDAMGQPSWSFGAVAARDVDGLLREALEAFVVMQAEAATVPAVPTPKLGFAEGVARLREAVGDEFDDKTVAEHMRELRGPIEIDLVEHLHRQREFSLRTFGPGDITDRVAGLIDHIKKELAEIAQEPTKLDEWIDVVILAFDGAWRVGATPMQIAQALQAKQIKNEARKWPDWRTAEPGKAIEHDRTVDDVGHSFLGDVANCRFCGVRADAAAMTRCRSMAATSDQQLEQVVR